MCKKEFPELFAEVNLYFKFRFSVTNILKEIYLEAHIFFSQILLRMTVISVCF